MSELHIKPISLRRTMQLVRSDYYGLLNFYKKEHSLRRMVGFLLYPGFIAVLGYRLCHFAHTRKWKLLSRLLQWFIQVLTGADINPACQIDESFVVLHSVGTIISAKIGRNVLLTAKVGMGGDASPKDIGAGPGLPVVGNGVVFGACSTVLGPYRIGDNAFVGAMSYVKGNVPAGSTVFGVPARVIHGSTKRRLSLSPTDPKMSTRA